MSYGDVQRQVMNSLPGVSLDVKTVINSVYQSLLEGWQWSFMRDESLLTLVAPYSTGTVAATQGSTALVGTSTVWTSDHVNRYIRIGDNTPFYKITARSSNTAITIETAYIEATVTGATYTIFQHIYSLNANCRMLTQPTFNRDLLEITLSALNRLDPKRLRTGTPEKFAYRALRQIEVWPRPDGAKGVRYGYLRKAPVLDDPTDSVLIREDILVNFAITRGYTLLAGQRPQYAKSYISLAAWWQQEGNKLLLEARAEDLKIYGVLQRPRDIYTQRVSPAGRFWEYDDGLDIL